MPAADVRIDPAQVRRLVDRQAARLVPGVAELPLTLVASGWDNEVYRLGSDLAVRLPRRDLAVPLIASEWTWLPVLAPHLPVSAPVPVLLGEPADGYPYPWLVCRWVPGEVVHSWPVAERGYLATELADALTALHRLEAPTDAPVNPWRGVPLAQRDDVVRARIHRWWGDDSMRDSLLEAWDAGLSATPYPGPARWLHGDPHPLNLAQVDGHLSGLLDFGDLTRGDPASDLATGWWTFTEDDRQVFQERVDATADHDDPHVWTRARAWAASFASAMEPDSPLDPVARHTAHQLQLDT